MKLIYIVFTIIFIIGVTNAELKKIGLCSCFNPDYDGSCCIVAKGYMYENVCKTLDWSYVEEYEKCCTKINGTYKCKPGYVGE